MTESITALSWNVQGEIGIDNERMDGQLEFLDEHASNVDLFLFQAVNYEQIDTGHGSGQLGSYIDYFHGKGFHVVHTGDWAYELATSTVQPHHDVEGAHNRCNLVASRWPIERRPLTLRNRGDGRPRNLNYYSSHFPEKLLVGEVDLADVPTIQADELAVWNVGIINGSGWGEEKLNMLETLYARISLQSRTTDVPVLLGGDFNAPKHESADGSITPHGANKGQYTQYPFYGDPHNLRDSNGEVDEYRFDQRWQLAEARIFDPDVGEWGMRDVYWAAEESPRLSSSEDFTHVVHNASPPGKRLDHLLVSEQFDVLDREIWNGVNTPVDAFDVSDHAPVVADLVV